MIDADGRPNNHFPLSDSPDAHAAILIDRVGELTESAMALSDRAWALSTDLGDTGDKALRAAVRLRRIARASRCVLGILDPF